MTGLIYCFNGGGVSNLKSCWGKGKDEFTTRGGGDVSFDPGAKGG